MFLAAFSSMAIPSFPKSSLARRWASSQAGTAFSIRRFPFGVSRKGWLAALWANGCRRYAAHQHHHVGTIPPDAIALQMPHVGE
jgi:hypothetical protein